MAEPQKNSTEEQSAPIVSPTQRKRATLSKPVFTVAAVLLLLLMGGIWLYASQTNKQNGPAAVCSDTFITQNANTVFQQTALQPYAALSQVVQAKSGYAKDPNCLYILTTTYVMTGDSAKAAATLAQLKTVYKPQTGFSKAFMPKADIGDLQSLVEAALHTTNGIQSTVEPQI